MLFELMAMTATPLAWYSFASAAMAGFRWITKGQWLERTMSRVAFAPAVCSCGRRRRLRALADKDSSGSRLLEH